MREIAFKLVTYATLWACLRCAYKITNFFRSYVEGVYTVQNGAYERNG